MSMPGSTSKAWFFPEAYGRTDEKTMTVSDPVCGMQVDIDKTAAQEEYGGWAYFFCSAHCHRLFKANPERYAESERQFAASPPSQEV